MSQPWFGITAGAEEASQRACDFGVNFCDLHFKGQVERLHSSLDSCDRSNLDYILNFEGAPIGWVPSDVLRSGLKNRPSFLGFMLDEADHMQINAHWPPIDYYGYDDRHYLAETDGLDLQNARQVVLNSLEKKKPRLSDRRYQGLCRISFSRYDAHRGTSWLEFESKNPEGDLRTSHAGCCDGRGSPIQCRFLDRCGLLVA